VCRKATPPLKDFKMSLKTEAYDAKRKIQARLNKRDRQRRGLLGDSLSINTGKKKISPRTKKSNANDGYGAGEIGTVDSQTLSEEIKSAGGVGPSDVGRGGIGGGFGASGILAVPAAGLSGLSAAARKRILARARIIR